MKTATNGEPYDADREVLLDEVFEEVSQKLKTGQSVDINEYAHRYPEVAERLKRALPSLQALAEWRESSDGRDVAVAAELRYRGLVPLVHRAARTSASAVDQIHDLLRCNFVTCLLDCPLRIVCRHDNNQLFAVNHWSAWKPIMDFFRGRIKKISIPGSRELVERRARS